MNGPEPLFIAGSAGSLFALHYPAPVRTGRALLVLPPFAEELNKSRRMLSLAARALQGRGHDVLVVDLYGTGDSAGEFVEASLTRWHDDLDVAVSWLAGHGAQQLDLLAVRGGALLLPGVAPPGGMTRGEVVLWQPVHSGRLLVRQFLRLRLAEEMTGREPQGPDPRSLLQGDGHVEVAGYEITRGMVAELEAIAESLSAAQGWRAWHWLEVVAPGSTALGPASQRAIEALRRGGAQVTATVSVGEPFWATPEIATVPALVDATVVALAVERP